MQHLENNNRTLENMLREIQEKNAMKQDYIAPTSELQFRTIENLDDRVHGKNTSQIELLDAVKEILKFKKRKTEEEHERQYK